MPTTYSRSSPSVNRPSSKTYSVSIYSGYANFRSRHPSLTRADSGARGIRGKITQFSPTARRNFLKKIFSLAVLPDLIITLTYPGFYSTDPKEWKRHLDNFSHEFKRRFPDSWFFWKLEPQKRGAPHFHLLGSLKADHINITTLRKFIAETWYSVVASGDERHLRAGTQADFIGDSFGKVKRYICKYVGKNVGVDLPQWATPGRWWGVIGRKNLPSSPCCHMLLPKDIFFKLRRLVRKWMGRFSSSVRYSKRLKKLTDFFILTSDVMMFRLLEGALGFFIPQYSSPHGASTVLDLELIPF